MHAQVKKHPEKSDKHVIKQAASSPQAEVTNFSSGFAENTPGATAAQLKLKERIDDNSRVNQLMAYQGIANSHTSKTVQRKNIIETDKGQENGKLIQKKETDSHLPSDLQSGIEKLSGNSMNDVQVFRNSEKPAQLQAHAFAQGSDIHLGPGQEKHLPHEAWHVVQQKQGRVQPTTQLRSAVPINDDKGLEQEADAMGAKALQVGKTSEDTLQKKSGGSTKGIVQKVGDGTEETPAPKKKKTLALRGEKKGLGTWLKNTFTKGTTFTRLEKEVEKFNAASAEEQEQLGKGIETLALTWLKDHSKETDENNVAKKESILEVLKEIRKGDRIKEAVKFGALKSEEHADKLGLSEQNIEKEASEKTKEFVSSDGKIKDVKGILKDTSFMTNMHEVMKEKVMSVESNLGVIDNNEKTLRADAAIHSFFESEKTKADSKGPDERRSVTAHAKEAYAGGFHSKIIGKGKFPTDGNSGKMFQDEDELEASKLSPYKSSSLAGAQEVHELNEEADMDLATLYTLTEQVQNLKAQEEESFKNPLTSGLGGHEEHAQEKRQQVKLLVEDAILYSQKVELEKERSKNLVQPLEADGRTAGFLRKGWDMAKTSAGDQITKIFTLGLASVSAKYKVGGLASSESFDLEEDSEGNLTETVKHEGTQGGSKYNFTGPRGVVKGIYNKMKETTTKASKFKNKKPITGFFIFSGVLQQLEKGLAYINQIVGTIQKWATGLTFIPGAAAITTPITAVCEAIKNAISMISQSSKAARMIFTSLVKIMNDDPQLWGLVSQNFNAGVAENLASFGAKGARLGYSEGTNSLTGEGAGDTFKEATNLNSKSIESGMKEAPGATTSDTVKAIGMGGTSLKGTDAVVSGGKVEEAVGKGIKEDKKGASRPIRAIEAFKTASKNAVPKAEPVISNAETVLDKSSETENLANKITPEVQKAVTEKEQTSDTEDPETTAANQEFKDQANSTKEEVGEISSTSGVIHHVAEEVVKTGIVATQRALIEKRIKAAKEEREKMKGQKGSGVN